MIKNIFVSGQLVNNDAVFLSHFDDSTNADIDLRSYSRGGRSGVSLGNPFYKGFTVSFELTIVARSQERLLQERDRLARVFQIQVDKDLSQTKQLTIELVDGSFRTTDVIFSKVYSPIRSQDLNKQIMQVTCQSEIEFWYGNTLKQETVVALNLGGFSSPTPIPLDISVGADVMPSVLTNNGNAEYYPTVELYAPLEDVTLINDTTGKSISIEATLTDDDVLVMDFYNRTAVLNGITNMLAGVTGNWWWLNPQTNVVRLVPSSGTGYAIVKYRDSYRGI